jgi:phosphoglycolate phosphatase-like HAD superfamily hydrolase
MNLAILDVDGTLLDNWRAEDACFADALRAFARCFGAAPSIAMIARTVDRFVDLLEAVHRTEPLVPVVGAARLLTQLPEHGWALAIATGPSAASLRSDPSGSDREMAIAPPWGLVWPHTQTF